MNVSQSGTMPDQSLLACATLAGHQTIGQAAVDLLIVQTSIAKRSMDYLAGQSATAHLSPTLENPWIFLT
jgi:hypothetical protein